jgi:hypothetical protein
MVREKDNVARTKCHGTLTVSDDTQPWFVLSNDHRKWAASTEVIDNLDCPIRRLIVANYDLIRSPRLLRE